MALSLSPDQSNSVEDVSTHSIVQGNNLQKQALKMQHSPVLPPFTPHARLRSTPHHRTTSNWKLKRDDRFPPLSKSSTMWKEARYHDEAYGENPTLLRTERVITDQLLQSYESRDRIVQKLNTVLSPTNTDQNKSFQSTTVLRSVPIMRRHLDTFGGRTFSIPAKTKAVPFHTGRFIFDPHNKPIFFEELTQNQRLQAEIAMVEKVRGLKRKRESVEYRWGWKKFDLYGFEVQRGERRNIQAEIQKLKELILPTMARDIYTGRGIRLPETHHTKRPVKNPTAEEPPYPPPPTSYHPRETVASKPPPTPPQQPYGQRHQTSVAKTARSRDRPVFKQIGPQAQSVSNVDLMVQSVPVPGIASSPVSRLPMDRSSSIRSALDDTQFDPAPQPTPVMKMHEPVEQIEVVEPQPIVPEEEPVGRPEKPLSPMVMETPVERSRSMAAPSASPDVKGQFNPLVSALSLEDTVATEFEELRIKFNELDQLQQGHISFDQFLTVCPTSINESQINYLRSMHNVTTQNGQFGPDEFIAMTTLAHQIIALNPSTQVMFDQINFETLEESISQYTELFTSVDRTGRGRIGVGALLQILGTTLQRQQLEPDTKLAKQIMETMQKDYDTDVSRMEFLAFLPYFLYLEEMT